MFITLYILIVKSIKTHSYIGQICLLANMGRHNICMISIKVIEIIELLFPDKRHTTQTIITFTFFKKGVFLPIVHSISWRLANQQFIYLQREAPAEKKQGLYIWFFFFDAEYREYQIGQEDNYVHNVNKLPMAQHWCCEDLKAFGTVVMQICALVHCFLQDLHIMRSSLKRHFSHILGVWGDNQLIKVIYSMPISQSMFIFL